MLSLAEASLCANNPFIPCDWDFPKSLFEIQRLLLALWSMYGVLRYSHGITLLAINV